VSNSRKYNPMDLMWSGILRFIPADKKGDDAEDNTEDDKGEPILTATDLCTEENSKILSLAALSLSAAFRSREDRGKLDEIVLEQIDREFLDNATTLLRRIARMCEVNDPEGLHKDHRARVEAARSLLEERLDWENPSRKEVQHLIQGASGKGERTARYAVSDAIKDDPRLAKVQKKPGPQKTE
jgi:hypothetical protein